ncbi:GNAT family protein [Streptomyces sp. NPDC002588]|uniref:GNAT family N-acetyltransferase n=1 Tax=Streptomyces sp. NPDC002588 TaxID=3154419 RepID=UPI003328448A
MTTHHTLLRPARLDDLDEITDLHTQARTAYYRAGGLPDTDPELHSHPEALSRRRAMWRRAVEDDALTVLCATQADELVGILAMGPPLDADVSPTTAAQLHQIHVRPGHWGQGIGTHLHTAFVDRLREASLSTGVLEHWSRNTRAHAFYTRHAWHPDGHHRPGPADTTYIRLRRS